MFCHVKITAQGEQSPWAVLIHGLFGSHDNLNLLTRELSPTHNVIQIDLPDHGQSPWLDAFGFAEYCELIRTTLLHHGVDKAHFIGHSLGGKMAMHIALTYPAMVTSLIVADIAPVTYTHRHQAVLTALAAVDLAQVTSRSDVKTQFDQSLADEGTRQFLLKSLHKHPQHGWQWRFNRAVLTRDYSELIQWPDLRSSYLGQTLFIKGQQSDYITLAHQAKILELFPNASSKIIAGTGHWLHAEKPLQFNRIVAQFLQA